MRMQGTDANDDFVGNRFVERGEADVVLFGVPYDGAVLGRKGAREGPNAIRGELRKLKSALPERWLDLGDARMPEDPREAGDVATRAMKAALETGAFPVALGGDHSLTYGLAKAVREVVGPIAVLNLDAHLDVREAKAVNSGTSFRRLVDDRIVAPEWLFEAGLRWFANSPTYLQWAKKAGIRYWSADQMGTVDVLAAIRAAFEAAPPERRPKGLYVSLDIDVLDESAAPGVSAPTPGGVTTAKLFEVMRALPAMGVPLLALDVMETAPPLDPDGRTARAAAHAIMNLAAYRGAARHG